MPRILTPADRAAKLPAKVVVIHVGIEQQEIERHAPGAWQPTVVVRTWALDVEFAPAFDESSDLHDQFPCWPFPKRC